MVHVASVCWYIYHLPPAFVSSSLTCSLHWIILSADWKAHWHAYCIQPGKAGHAGLLLVSWSFCLPSSSPSARMSSSSPFAVFCSLWPLPRSSCNVCTCILLWLSKVKVTERELPWWRFVLSWCLLFLLWADLGASPIFSLGSFTLAYQYQFRGKARILLCLGAQLPYSCLFFVCRYIFIIRSLLNWSNIVAYISYTPRFLDLGSIINSKCEHLCKSRH